MIVRCCLSSGVEIGRAAAQGLGTGRTAAAGTGEPPQAAPVWDISDMPGLAILLTVIPLNLFGDWLTDILDPRLRQLEKRAV